MARIKIPLNDFSFGEVSPSLRSRTDSNVYTRSGESVKNFFVRAEGGVIRRPATRLIDSFSQSYDDSLTQQIRIEPFIFSEDEKYIVAFSDGKIEIFRIPLSGSITKVATLTADVDANAIPIDNTNLNQFTYAQRGDFMFLAHQDFLCRMLVRTGLTSFEVRVFSFDESLDGNRIYQPYYNFQPNGVTISASATSGTGVTLTSSANYFESDHVGTRILIDETEALITGFTNATTVTATIKGTLRTQLGIDALRTKNGTNIIEVTHPLHGLSAGASITIDNAAGLGGISASNVNGTFTIRRVIDENRYDYDCGHSASSTVDGGGSPTVESSAATTNWFEQSYSPLRGFPAAITFHEDRLWFGGTQSQPDGIWGSKTSFYFNFDIGDADDDDALDLDSNIGVNNTIRHLVSNRDLQVFASEQEFYIPSFADNAITPSNAKISAQTPYGTGYVRPQSLDGSTLFVQATGTAVRDYVYSDAEGAYIGNMISLLSSHLVDAPLQLATVKGSLNRPGAYAFFLMSNGKLGVYYQVRNENKAGWMNWETEGNFHSICSVDEDLFCVTVRDDGTGTNKLFLEQFDQNLVLDFSDEFSGSSGVFDVSSHFANGAVVDVVDGTEYLGEFTVSGGEVDVSAVKASTSAQIGYKYIPELKTLPLDAAVAGGPLTGRPRKITLITLDLESTLSVSVNGTNLIVRDVTFDPSLPRVAVSGKKEFRVLGYSKDPRVTISQIAPLDLQINGIVAEVAF